MLVVRLEKVFEAAIVVLVVRGLTLAASSDDVGLTRLRELWRRARWQMVRADMALECVNIYRYAGGMQGM